MGIDTWTLLLEKFLPWVHKATAEHSRRSFGDSAGRSFAELFLGWGAGSLRSLSAFGELGMSGGIAV